MDINVNYHSSIRIGDIYVDPFKIEKVEKEASYIFITHSHYDHLSFDDINKIVNKSTIFVCTRDVSKEIKKIYSNNIIVEVEPNKKYMDFNILFSTFSSYNINKKFHPKANNWVGYIIQVEGVKYAIIGDSDFTDEVKNIECDVLFVPIGGTYTMDALEASKLTNIINPKVVIPVHYNGIVGSKNDEKQFLKGLNKDIKCKIYL